ncbi:MAG: dTDP-4-dehydrorhamnose reductase [Acidobacteria bacterium]|nr:dTDP-4-dehydrorhamnose reductase [Acidobacteriota bacterium]
MLGSDLMPVLAQEHVVLGLDHAACDITDENVTRSIVEDWRPELIVNCAAFPDVDGCERDPERAFAVNARGAGNVARAAETVGARLYHISTDYVFDGTKRSPYNEDDPVNPVSIYGQSKLEGEKQVLGNGSGSRHLILRTSWLYGIHKTNFVDRTLEQARIKDELQFVADQIACPTWTLHLSQKIAELVRTGTSGIMHAAGSGECSRQEFAAYIVQQLGRSIPVKPLTWAQLNLPATRPAYSVMGARGLEKAGLAPLPHWEQAVDEYMRVRQAVPAISIASRM